LWRGARIALYNRLFLLRCRIDSPDSCPNPADLTGILRFTIENGSSPMTTPRQDLRNIAIIAHVDHG